MSYLLNTKIVLLQDVKFLFILWEGEVLQHITVNVSSDLGFSAYNCHVGRSWNRWHHVLGLPTRVCYSPTCTNFLSYPAFQCFCFSQLVWWFRKHSLLTPWSGFLYILCTYFSILNWLIFVTGIIMVYSLWKLWVLLWVLSGSVCRVATGY